MSGLIRRISGAVVLIALPACSAEGYFTIPTCSDAGLVTVSDSQNGYTMTVQYCSPHITKEELESGGVTAGGMPEDPIVRNKLIRSREYAANSSSLNIPHILTALLALSIGVVGTLLFAGSIKSKLSYRKIKTN